MEQLHTRADLCPADRSLETRSARRERDVCRFMSVLRRNFRFKRRRRPLTATRRPPVITYPRDAPKANSNLHAATLDCENRSPQSSGDGRGGGRPCGCVPAVLLKRFLDMERRYSLGAASLNSAFCDFVHFWRGLARSAFDYPACLSQGSAAALPALFSRLLFAETLFPRHRHCEATLNGLALRSEGKPPAGLGNQGKRVGS